VPALAEALKDPWWRVREESAKALERIGPGASAAVPALAAALNNDEHWHVRLASAWALGKIGPAAQTAVPALREALQDEARYVRERSA
jgi:HEAT repeat protein